MNFHYWLFTDNVTSPGHVLLFDVRMTLANESFDDTLNNATSPRFLALQLEFCRQVSNIDEALDQSFKQINLC